MPIAPQSLSLLDDPLLGIELTGGEHVDVHLPELIARLSRGELVELTGLRAHQQHAWHAFLTQLVALTLARAGESKLSPRDAAWWRKALIATAQADGAGPEAFSLVVHDLGKAAFLQPPIPSGSLAELKNQHSSPTDELDVLITSKNHDVKRETISVARPEHWIYALVTLQTMQGFLGAGNYGIARMNGGFASRPCVAFTPSMASAHRFTRDVQVLLDAREELFARTRAKKPIGLVWCVPWDGTKSIPFRELDPFFIEICRRVRLTRDPNGEILAHRGSSKVPRIDAKDLLGNTGDAWTPVARKTSASLTVSESGFSYDRVRDLLAPENWKHGAAGELRETDGDHPFWVGQVLTRGQGKTDGYHERWLPIPPHAADWFRDETRRQKLASRAAAWVEMAGIARLKVLKPAMLALLQGGPEKLNFKDNRADSATERFDRKVDEHFFGQLFAHLDDTEEEADTAWQNWLRDQAWGELKGNFDAVPVPIARRPRAIARAEHAFRASAYKNLPRARRARASANDSQQGVLIDE